MLLVLVIVLVTRRQWHTETTVLRLAIFPFTPFLLNIYGMTYSVSLCRILHRGHKNFLFPVLQYCREPIHSCNIQGVGTSASASEKTPKMEGRKHAGSHR